MVLNMKVGPLFTYYFLLNYTLVPKSEKVCKVSATIYCTKAYKRIITRGEWR